MALTCVALAVGLHLGTYHFDRSRHLNEVNLGAYVACDDVGVGLYHNSLGRPSVWAGYQFHVGPVDLTVGAVTGYRKAPILPLVVPSVRLGHFRLSLLLPIEKRGGGLHLSTEF